MSWLISNALMNSLSLQGLAVESLVDTSLDGEQSVQSSGNPIPQAYLSPDKMMVFSRLSRFGMTYKPLTENLGEELLTSYLEGFLAKTLAQLEKGQELMESEAECGEKWRASFTKYDLDTRSWKTHQCSLLEDSEEFLETWPQWGLMRDGECWEQKTLEQTIRGTEFGLSPNGVDSFHTPNTTGLDGGSNSRKALKKRQMIPTPTSSMMPCEGTVRIMRKAWESGEFTLEEASAVAGRDVRKSQGKVQAWPTPVCQDSRHATTRHLDPKNNYWKSNLGEVVMSLEQPNTGGRLNPTWVEWLMGWPLGWTDLKPLEMDKSHFVPQPHGES